MPIKALFRHRKNFGRIAVLAVFSAILLWSAYVFSSTLASKPVYDFLVRITAPARISDDVVVVTIDDQSIGKIGRWPWKRTYYTDIFEYLENIAGARVVVFDSVLVSYGEKADDREFFQRFSRLEKVIPGIFFSKKHAFFHNEQEQTFNRLLQNKFSVETGDTRFKEIKTGSEYLSCSYSLKEIMESARSLGSVLSHPDDDGIIRKAEHLFHYKDCYYPSLGMAVLKKLYPDGIFEIKNDSVSFISGEKIFSIPAISNNNGTYSYIKWYKGIPYKTISAWKVIKQEGISPEQFRDKIVVVGTTSTALKDIKSTPLKADYPGVYIQATIIENLLHNDHIYRPGPLQKALLLSGVVLGGFLAIFMLPPLYSSILLMFAAVGYFHFCLFFAYPNSIAPDPVTPVIFIICVMLVGYGYEYFIEDEKRRKTRNLIAKYVSKDVMETILADIDGAKLGGKRADISVLFVDIRNFTHISETRAPEEVSELLNEYFSCMIPIIFKYKGTVNKFIGDALLVIFGAPVENTEHPQLAVKCAFEMLEKSEEIPDITIGIGISTGEAFVGNVGSEERLEYSAIGNTVNIASRLEAFNKLYKTSILISESTFERVRDITETVEVDSVCVTQNSEPIRIFELKKMK